MNPSFPTSPADLTVETLSDALGRPVGAFDLTSVGGGRGNLGDIVRIQFDDGSPSLVAKFAADRAENLEAAKRSRLFEREVQFYQRLAPQLDARTPQCHAAHYDPTTARFFLLLEHIPAVANLDSIAGVGPDTTRLVLAELAKLHLGGRQLLDQAWLQGMRFEGRIANLTILIEKGWPRLARLCPDIIDATAAPEIQRRFVTLMNDMADLDQTIVHGDAKPDNLHLTSNGIVVLDWQAVGYGPAAWDVAYAMINCLTTEDRRTHEADLLVDYPLDLSGYEEALLFGVIVAAALTVIGDPTEPRRLELVRTTAERAMSAMEDHGVY